MKKLLILLTVLLTMFVCVNVSIQTTYADNNTTDVSDEMLLTTVANLLPVGSQQLPITILRQDLLYDNLLQPYGKVYTFKVNNQNGFAIMQINNSVCEVIECYFEAENPYLTMSGTNIYIPLFNYIKLNNGSYYDALSGNAISEKIKNTLSIGAQISPMALTTTSELVSFVTRNQVADYSVATRPPRYTEIPGLSNECGAVAGANLLGYYDRFMVDLIPNFTPGKMISSTVYIYAYQNAEVDSVITQLYQKMDINNGVQGVTVAKFKSGFSSYCSAKGYTTTFFELMDNIVDGRIAFNYPVSKSKLIGCMPTLLFLSNYNITTMTLNNNNTETLSILKDNQPHVMVAFGYREIEYTLSNNTTRMDKYLLVSSGLSERSSGYFNISQNSIIDNAYCVHIM
ncbi:MAG: hypothetical protein RR054_05455 [Clostridia bacterium]